MNLIHINLLLIWTEVDESKDECGSCVSFNILYFVEVKNCSKNNHCVKVKSNGQLFLECI